MIDYSNQLKVDNKPILEHIELLAFDRSATSVGETKAINYIQEELRINKINSLIEYFSWNSPIRLLMKTFYLIVIIFFLMLRLILVIVLFYFIKYLFNKTRNISFVEKEHSKNLVSTIKAINSANYRPVIIFSAHYDSISSRIPYGTQKVLLWIIRVVILPYITLVIFLAIWLSLKFLSITQFNLILVYLITIVSSLGIGVIVPFFLFLFTSSKSTGSIDNASGVALLIELAKILKEKPLENHDVIFLWCGAEEWGLKGSKDYCKRHLKELTQNYNLDKSININIDMVGTYVGLLNRAGFLGKKSINKDLNNLFKSAAEKLNIRLILENKRINPKSDYKSFHSFLNKSKSKFQVSCFHSAKDSMFIHSYQDTPDNCSNEVLNRCLNIIFTTILNLDFQLITTKKEQ